MTDTIKKMITQELKDEVSLEVNDFTEELKKRLKKAIDEGTEVDLDGQKTITEWLLWRSQKVIDKFS